VVKVVELRLRFIALMAITALVFAYWDELANRYDKWMRPAAGEHAQASGIEYYCPMHPQIVQAASGNCPICGMPLAKRKKGEKTTLPMGVTARVELAPFRVAQAGIKTVEVAYSPLTQTVTTVGYVAFDERRLANIISKVPGRSRVEKLYVNFTGQDVAVDQTLAELYSPELVQGVQELLTAVRRAEQGGPPPSDPGRSLQADRREMVRASQEKLERWGITKGQIDEILTKRKAELTVPILSPFSGHVIKKNVVEGQEVPQGFTLFEVANLDTVWILAQIFEHQLGLIHPGHRVEARLEAFPGEVFPGTVDFIQQHLDPSTRSVEVRFALENPGRRLRPGMFAMVTLEASVTEALISPARSASVPPRGGDTHPSGLTPEQQKTCLVTNLKLGSMGDPVPVEVEGRKVWTCCSACPPKLKAEPAKYLARLAPAPPNEVLSVPESAVIDTGTRKIVYVEAEPGVFEGREVVLGPRVGNRFPVLEGLAAGEKVATNGAFLIDAESRLNPAQGSAEPGVEAPSPRNDAPPHSAASTKEGVRRK
jgi:Cu(I)/Ag(I) efflux system membrane fusion protein